MTFKMNLNTKMSKVPYICCINTPRVPNTQFRSMINHFQDIVIFRFPIGHNDTFLSFLKNKFEISKSQYYIYIYNFCKDCHRERSKYSETWELGTPKGL